MRSIRARLLTYVVAALVLSWIAVTVITWLEARHEIEELFDAQLAQTARIVSQLSLPELRTGERVGGPTDGTVAGHKYEEHIGFQVWRGGQRMFRSPRTPALEAAQPTGFSNLTRDGVRWRIFGMPFRDGTFRIYTSEDDEARDELIRAITRATLLPLLVAVPVLALLFWFGIGRGLLPLTRIAEQVARRDYRQLDSIDEGPIPTEIRPLIDALNGLFRRLRERFEQERRFTADAAHELRTPLAGIKTQAQVALRAVDETQRRTALENISRGVDHGSHLVAQMLTLARLDPDSLEREFQPLALLEFCEQGLVDIAPLAQSRDVELELLAAADARHWSMSGHAAGLAVLLRNLLDNAVRHTPPGGQVRVSLERDTASVQLTVTDTGPGIPTEQRARVFDRFYRADHGDDYGCGLGLAIVHRIVELHAGSIELGDGADGTGLRVRVVLPR